MIEHILVLTEIGQVAVKIIDETDNAYIAKWGDGYTRIEKEYTFEENGVICIHGHDII